MDKSLFTREYKIFLCLLKELRTQRGVTQEDIAMALKESQSFVSKCERGERRIDVIELRQFCQAIGLSLSEFAKKLETAILAGQNDHV
jgi:transcriptional regulator with XRE-family HTH domain